MYTSDPDKYVTPIMAYYVRWYCQYCREIKDRAFRTWIEEKAIIHPIVKGSFGTIDFAALTGTKDKYDLEMVDLKYGKGQRVMVKNNMQAIYYALALINEFKLKPRRIKLTIFQPRLMKLELPFEAHIDTCSYSYKQVVAYASTFRDADRQAARMERRFKKGKSIDLTVGAHCAFCRAKFRCRKAYDFIKHQGPLDTIGFKYAKDQPVQVKRDDWAAENVNLMTPDQIAEHYVWCDMAKRMATEIKTKATTLAATGKKLKGLKLVAGRKNRYWRSERLAAKELLHRGVAKSKLYRKSFISVQEAEELLGRPFDKDDEIVVYREGKATLVVESDPRKGIDHDSEFDTAAHGL